VTPESLPDPGALRLQTTVNGRQMQDGNTRDMIFDVSSLVEFLSQSTTLLPGTAIMTGTPAGVGMGRTPPVWLKAGDEVSVSIEGIVTLTNPVRGET
jgi:2-keto-4-pentenoate hydratase/2-oxohepta-3-ene-1,7-dioic acid hydratase in catechol pathway